MKIYTRGGDKGFTATLAGKRVLKSDTVIDCVGNIDELSAVIGVLKVKLKNSKKMSKDEIISKLTRIQKQFLSINSAIISSPESRFSIKKEWVKELEQEIDVWDRKLPKLSAFVLPGENEIEAFFHLARAVARRVERSVVKLNREVELNEVILQYFNRLSDWFFVVARIQ